MDDITKLKAVIAALATLLIVSGGLNYIHTQHIKDLNKELFKNRFSVRVLSSYCAKLVEHMPDEQWDTFAKEIIDQHKFDKVILESFFNRSA